MESAFNLEGKKILITGSSSGIGRATAILASQHGAQIILCGRNPVQLEETLKMLRGDGHVIFNFDLTKQDEYLHLLSKIAVINGIVHAAGIMKLMPIKHLKDDFTREMAEINYFIPMRLTRDIISGKKMNRFGSIVFITSINGGVVGSKANSIYCSTKAAITGFCKSISLELGPLKIRANCIAPGMIKTEGIDKIIDEVSIESITEDKKKYPLGDYGEAEDVAYACVYLLSYASKWITGTTLTVDGGFTSQ